MPHPLPKPLPSKMPPKPSRWTSLSLDTWLWEILALIFSTSAFTAIFVLLAVHDQKPSPALPSGITLNTIISILSTSSKSSLIFAISSAIGQLKWIAFRRSRKPLSDLQLADDAGRGPLGSFWLILRHKGKDLLCLGAAVTMLCLAFDPFMQQILSYPIRLTPNKNEPHMQASFKRARYPLFDAGPNRSIKSVIHAGIWTDSFALDPLCPSGNCTFAPFVSMGWCSACSDVTASASFTCDASSNGTSGRTKDKNNATDIPCAVSLSSPLSSSSFTELKKHVEADPRILGALSVPVDYVWSVESVNLEKNVTLSGVRNPLAVFWRARVDVPLNGSMWFEAHIHSAVPALRTGGIKLRDVTQCVLAPCAREYTVSVTRGIPAIRTSEPRYGDLLFDSSRMGNGGFCWRAPDTGSGSGSSRPSASQAVNVSAVEFTPLYNTSMVGTRVNAAEGIICPEEVLGSSSFTNGSDAAPNPQSAIVTHDVLPRPLWKILRSTESWSFVKPANATAGQWRLSETTLYDNDVLSRIQDVGFETVVGNVAASLTRTGMELSSETVAGDVSVSVAYVRVTWAFIALPMLLLLAGVVFVLATVYVSGTVDVGLWKASVLPAFWVGIEGGMLHDQSGSVGGGADGHKGLSGYQVMSWMDGKARETVVSLGVVDREGGSRLRLQ
ncbi:DUF3176 domain-containing protein [Aspergillus mulundensis]|uniref:Uncharacterized protein n=1 Tax=Aspergillus mulundensis TaxID=1810919 RepID=A0A3D8R0N8_9EURO|nr:hypothetical protein DSM5745_09260 [Aspergillus mulundensis]RDW67394.1 hypothetical protein DSM5745_09260 [Aspergillus mulundensis]